MALPTSRPASRCSASTSRTARRKPSTGRIAPGELENYTSAEIEFIVNEAARIALAQNRLIGNGDILNAAGNNPPAHTAAAIEEMRGK